MASTASDNFPSSPTAPASAFLDDHNPLFLSSASAFLEPAATSFFPAPTTDQAPQPPLPASAARKPPRKRPRASRRQPTTVVSTDASNFRAMVEEFTGFPVPPPFAHLGPGGVLFGAGAPSLDSATATGVPPFQLLHPSPLKIAAAPTSLAHSMYANPTAAAAATASSSSSELYSGFGQTPLVDAVPRYADGFQAAEDEIVGHGHGIFSSFLHAGDRYHSHY